jgi:uncharacterized membrane protein (DUF106 family)
MEMIDLHNPSIALIVISASALLMNIVSGILNKYLVYTPEFIKKKREVDRLMREYEMLRRSRDPKKLKKMEKKLRMINKMRAELAMKSLRPFIIILAVFWIIWGWLNSLYGGMGEFVILPFPLPFIGITANFFWWYVISSIALGTITRVIYQPIE